MRRTVFSGIVLLAGLLVLTSCSSDDTVEQTSDCYISAFTLGYMKRTVHTTDSLGNDSTYTVSFSGSYYPIIIDQREQVMYNAEELPVETKVDKVLASITAAGSVYYAPVSDTTSWTKFSESDSINFENPLYFRAYSNDGNSFRTYTLTIRIRTSDLYGYTWYKMTDVPSTLVDLDTCMHLKTVTFGDSVLIYSKGRGNSLYCTRGIPQGDDVVNWTTSLCTGATAADIVSLQNCQDTLWMSSASSPTSLFRSLNGITWEKVPQTRTVSLIASSDDVLFAVSDNSIFKQKSNTVNWESMALEVPFSYFPTETTSLTYTQNNGSQRVMVAGYNAVNPDSSATLWSYLDKLGSYYYEDPWTYFNWSPDNKYALPLLYNLQMVAYNNALFAFGGASRFGQYHSALDAFYKSLDGGITWKEDGYLAVPKKYASLPQFQSSDYPISGCVMYNRIWLVIGHTVFTIQANRY